MSVDPEGCLAAELRGTPSDQLPGILAFGDGDVTAVFVSLSARDPDGRDAEYLEWHTLDHRAEQHRLPGLRGSLRFVSTSECRSARAAVDPRYEATDHVMAYLFADQAPMDAFYGLGEELFKAGRMQHRLPAVEGDLYLLRGKAAAPRAVAGADVLPWRPAHGLYLLLELGVAAPDRLVEIDGVAGVWWATTDSEKIEARPWFGSLTSATEGVKQVSLCFTDEDPIDVAERIEPVLKERWADGSAKPLLAAPFRAVVPYEWDRHLP
ncbi:MAG: hypothetical protein OXG34_12495 [bacterium]|nr:hypothetical protein [bacterium]MCY3889558.1 hypothetical protein [bacterium]MCY3962463.1 hypothetical protein [bacterium]MCY4134995.1 hypothetical protein [bacterium]